MTNLVMLIGRTTKEIELNSTASGKALCRFSLAVDKQTRQEEEKQTNFFDIVCWNGLAERVAKYLKKGRKCCVTGKLDTRTYTAQDGTNRKVVEIVASEVEFLDSLNSDNNEKEKSTKQQAPEVKAIFEPLDDSKLPF